MRGSYVAEPRLLAWLCERTVLVESGHELHLGSEYTENIYNLIFAFAAHAQRGLQYLVCVSVCVCVCRSVCLSVCYSTSHFSRDY